MPLKRLHIIAPALILVAAAVVRVSEPTWLTQLQFFVFDTLMREYPRDYAPDPEIPVRIVDIDEDSLARLGQWPWSRIKLAQMVVNLRQAGAAVIAFDVVFAEKDRLSPPNAVEEWAVLEGAEEVLDTVRQLPDFDAAFAQYLQAFNPIVLGFALTADERLPRIPKFGGTFATKGLEVGGVRRLVSPVYTGAVSNLTIFDEAAAGNGSFNVEPELDGLVRRVPLIVQLDTGKGGQTNLYPSLSVEAFRVVQGVSTMIVYAAAADTRLSVLEQGNVQGLSSIQVGAKTIPVDRRGRMWLHSTGPRPERYISAWKVLEGDIPREDFQNAVVLIGTSAAGLFDLRATALAPRYPGVEIHAEIAEQIIADHYLERPAISLYAELGFMLVLGLSLILLMPRIGAMPSAALGIVGVAGAFGFTVYMFTEELRLFDPVFPSATNLAIFLTGTVLLYAREEAQRRQIRGAFAQYLSPALVEQLADEPERLKLGGETKILTFLFCDVRGFTTISESFKGNPQGLTVLINRFLTPLTDKILERQGTIDKYMGDCIMAFWNAPLDVADHEKQACDSALAMFEALNELNEEREREAEAAGETFLPLNIGIGVNTGDCVVGNMGSAQRFDYSVLGDAVNLASRLEGQSKGYAVGIIIGPDTRAAARDDFATLELDRIAVKGKAEAVTIFTLLGRSNLRHTQAFLDYEAAHESMLAAYRAQDWDGAEAALDALRGKLDGMMDPFNAMMTARIAEYRTDPPPAEWDGVYVATSK
jgi:adenylate cyclase